MAQDYLYTIINGINKLRSIGIEPKLITMHPKAYNKMIAERKKSMINFVVAKKSTTFCCGVKVARSSDIDPDNIYIS